MRRRAFRQAAGSVVFLLAGWHLPVAADELLYYVEGGRIVFTNTPSRHDALPVPGLEQRVQAVRRDLPETPYDEFIDKIAMQNGLDPALIKAVALVESAFDPQAVSAKGAMGLMQLMPLTALRYGVKDPLDPYESLRGGAQHLRELLEEFGGNLTLALAAYNAGAGAVRRHGGVPSYVETQAYVRKVHTKLGRPPRRQDPAGQPRWFGRGECHRRYQAAGHRRRSHRREVVLDGGQDPAGQPRRLRGGGPRHHGSVFTFRHRP